MLSAAQVLEGVTVFTFFSLAMTLTVGPELDMILGFPVIALRLATIELHTPEEVRDYGGYLPKIERRRHNMGGPVYHLSSSRTCLR